MGKSNDWLLYTALTVADASWVFALLATFCMVCRLEAVPLSWPLLVSIMGLSIIVGRLVYRIKSGITKVTVFQAFFGLVVTYMAVALSDVQGTDGIGLGWLVTLITGNFSLAEGTSTVFGLATAAYLWRRGLLKIQQGTPSDSLRGTFKRGSSVIAFGLIMEIFLGETVGLYIVVFPFFGASLGGMALGQLELEDSVGTARRFWSRIVLSAVAIILSFGVIIGLTGGAIGGGPIRVFGAMLAELRDWILWVVSFPLKYFVGAIFGFFQWLVELFGVEDPTPAPLEAGGVGGRISQAEEASESLGPVSIENLVSILSWPVAICILLVILYVFIKSLRKIEKRTQPATDLERESIRGDAKLRDDLASLFGRLIPGFFRRRVGGGHEFVYPKSEPGITEIFRLYHRCLKLGLDNGTDIDPHLTPLELMGRLARSLPQVPVALLTERFNAACYGHEPSLPSVISNIEARLDAVATRRT